MLESKVTYYTEPVKYIPALGFSQLTTFFDAFQKWAAKEATFKPKLIQQADLKKNFNVLDLGCGTGTLTLLAKKSQPNANITGIDIDQKILNIAKLKAIEAKVNIKFDHGTAFNLPYPNNSFDRIISSLMLHHLTRENKLKALKETYRILIANGEIHIADIGKPQNFLMQLPSTIIRHTEEAEDNVEGLIPQMLTVAGFKQVRETSRLMTAFGTISLYKGLKPE